MPKEQTGIAGEFWFFSQLHMLGYEAYITFGNTNGIDISVKLSDGSTLTFDVKSKVNFNGCFQYLDNVKKQENHFIAFIDLQLKKELDGKCILLKSPRCFIIKSKDLKYIAFRWEATTGAKGYGFEAKLLPFLKMQQDESITKNNIARFKERHNINEIDFELYSSVIWTIEDFENNYFLTK